MTFMAYMEKLETIKHLSQHKRTGTVEMLAERLNVSERTARRMVQQLREGGFPITYNRYRYTYEVKNASEKNL